MAPEEPSDPAAAGMPRLKLVTPSTSQRLLVRTNSRRIYEVKLRFCPAVPETTVSTTTMAPAESSVTLADEHFDVPDARNGLGVGQNRVEAAFEGLVVLLAERPGRKLEDELLGPVEVLVVVGEQGRCPSPPPPGGPRRCAPCRRDWKRSRMPRPGRGRRRARPAPPQRASNRGSAVMAGPRPVRSRAVRSRSRGRLRRTQRQDRPAQQQQSGRGDADAVTSRTQDARRGDRRR